MLHAMSEIRLYNSLTRQKETFTPADAAKVRMYVCGPTVYARPHIGNARSAVVYDMVFRLLRHVYGEGAVTYVRNITDVDDKIIDASKASGEPISALTERITEGFHADMAALNCLPPTQEPRATAFIGEMIAMIEHLLANGHAYEARGHVLFDVASDADYGKLSGKVLEDLIAGARVGVESYKRNPGDFVLWKPGNAGDPESSLFDSPWGRGRPGWHIECSAMSTAYFGPDFDLHGGGADLKFPHHENEIAQSCGAHPGSGFAKCWMHNGFLTVNGEKMSKSLGNFITVEDLLGRGVQGEVIRLALLSTRYSEPLNWTDKLLEDAKKTLDSWYRAAGNAEAGSVAESVIEALGDDFNSSQAIRDMHRLSGAELKASAQFFGLLQLDAEAWFRGGQDDGVEVLIKQRIAAKKNRDFAGADALRQQIEAMGIVLEDKRDGTTEWRRA